MQISAECQTNTKLTNFSAKCFQASASSGVCTARRTEVSEEYQARVMSSCVRMGGIGACRPGPTRAMPG